MRRLVRSQLSSALFIVSYLCELQSQSSLLVLKSVLSVWQLSCNYVMQRGTQVKLIHIARRRLDGLIDPHWVEGYEAYKAQSLSNSCPYTPDTQELSSWVEGWMDADSAHLSDGQ